VLSLLALAPFLDPLAWLLCLCSWLLLCRLCRWLSCYDCVVSAGSGSVFGSVALALVSLSLALTLLLYLWLSGSCSCVPVAGPDSGTGSVVSVAGKGSVALTVLSLSLALFWLRGSGSCVSVAGSLALAVLSLQALSPFLDPSVWLLCLCLCR